MSDERLIVRDILPILLNWHEENKIFAVARVLSTWGSAPRRRGATMLISQDMEVVGSVSGGCIEGSVIESALSVLESGVPQVLQYGVDDERAWSVGLSCGGHVRILVETWSSFEGSGFVEMLQADAPFVLASMMGSDKSSHNVIYRDESVLEEVMAEMEGQRRGDGKTVREAALAAIQERESRELELSDRNIFLHVFPALQRLVIIGGADITARLLALAKEMDFETIVIDPRDVFTSSDRFDVLPDHLVAKWPQDILPSLTLDEDTYAVLLTHDPKIDDPALHVLLERPVAYIGALGGKRTQEKRNNRLLDKGFSQDQIDRIHGPIGVDIGAASPKEIALSIMAEIVAVRNRKTPS